MTTNPTDAKDALLPCPFCGAPPKVFISEYNSTVICSGCNAACQVGNPGGAIPMWQARATTDREEVKRLRAVVKAFVELVPEPVETSLGFDEPPGYATSKEHDLAFTFHEARALLSESESEQREGV